MRVLYFMPLLFTLALTASGQASRKKNTPAFNSPGQNPFNTFLDKQWWLGLKGGVNLTNVSVEQRYSVISPGNYPLSETDKQYDKFNVIGSHVAVEITFYYKGFSFSLQPAYRHTGFTYTNEYEWTDPENASNQLELNYSNEQKLDHGEIPLIIKYDIIGNKLRPYVQVGVYYSFLINATKSVEVSGIDYASGGENKFTNDPVIVGATDLFAQNLWGLLGGIGANYNLGNVRLNVDLLYRHDMSLANSPKNRFGNDRLSGIAEAMDDIQLRNVSFSVGCLFPMRFLASGFKTLDQR